VAEEKDMQYGVFPVVPRANETDQPKWTDEELDKLPVEFKPADDKQDSKDEDKKEEGAKADDKSTTATKSTGSAPASGQPALPKA
jgi:hypothetical protein